MSNEFSRYIILYIGNTNITFIVKLFEMLVLRMLLIAILLLNYALAEWVDVPQFSDGKKVYRLSAEKQDQFYKFSQTNVKHHFFSSHRNITYLDTLIEQGGINNSAAHDFYKMKDNMKGTAVLSYMKTNTDVYKETVPIKLKEGYKSKYYFNNSSNLTTTELLEYLPVDIFKNVHQILISQPTSTSGKIQFLKNFENILITEIESRLSDSITIDRHKRGAEHYEHSYDHEHATGFPSIEGALMAISFLTFAVYLVRLVMLLFRNMNNNMSTTTGATLLLGRRKKSINKFDEDTIMILEKLHHFSTKFE